MEGFAIVVSSCDKSHDCWEPLFFSFKKYWPDCPFPKFIITGALDIDEGSSGFSSLKVGEDNGWASNFDKAIQMLGDRFDYLMYLQEDFWLKSDFDTNFLVEQLSYCRQKNLDYLRLTFPWMDEFKIDETHALSPISERQYAVCLSASIWKTASLRKVLIPGWSGWDFESKVQSLDLESFSSEVLLSTVSRVKFPFIGLACGAVRRGRWLREACRFLRKNGFSNLIPSREKEGFIYTIIILNYFGIYL